MRRVVFGLLGLVVSLNVHAYNVFGKDNRKRVSFDDGPYNKILKLRGHNPITKKRWSCTASLVGEDLVLTNAHCVASAFTIEIKIDEKGNRTEQTIMPGKIQLFSKYENRTFEESATAVELAFGTDHLSNDWAVLRIDKPLGKKYGYFKTLTELKTKISPNNYNLILGGFSGDLDRGEYLTSHEGCLITRHRVGHFYHNCDMNGGASGAPILKCDGNKQNCVIVALNSAHLIPMKKTGEGEEEKMEVDLTVLAHEEYHKDYPNIAVRPSRFAIQISRMQKINSSESEEAPLDLAFIY